MLQHANILQSSIHYLRIFFTQSKVQKRKLGLFSLCLLLISQSFANTNPLPAQQQTAQLRLVETKSKKINHAILLKAHAQVKANAIATSVTLTQTFKNNTADWVEGTYVFPLPENAAVDKMTMQIGEKKIVGKIREKKQAQQLYQAAVDNGQKAALLESHRDNLFTAKAGNIPPNSEITVILHYVQATHYQSGVFSLVIPTTYTPRYIVKNDLPDDNEQETATVNINEKLPNPVFTHNSNNQLSLDITVDAGHEITQINNPSHTLAPKLDETKQSAKLIADNLSMDRDFHLNWKIVKSDKPLALAFSEKTAQGYFTSLLFMPPQQKTNTYIPRETVLIIDTSGSMSGDAIRQAKAGALAALQYLRPEDKFNLIEFNDRYSKLFSDSQPATLDNISLAKTFIQTLDADGGTEMYQPLEAALNGFEDNNYLRQIVFLTDGAVSNETDLFQLIHKKLGKSRLFTVAIGAAPNAFFMKQAATFGRGSETSISEISEVSEKINALFSQLQHPALTDIEVNVDKSLLAERYPNPIADLYLGAPVVAHIKTDKEPKNGAITITGSHSTEGKKIAWQHQVNITESHHNEQGALAKLWARQKIDRLNHRAVISGESQAIDDEILKIGLDYQLVTKKTAFVAIEESISRDTLNNPLKNKTVANAMPAGNTMTFPTTATSSTLTALLGSLLLLIAIAIALVSHYRREYAYAAG